MPQASKKNSRAKARAAEQGKLTTAPIESPINGDLTKQHIGGSSPIHRLINIGVEEEPNSVPVTQNSVLSIAPYWRATNILCGLVGRIPLELKRRSRGNKFVTQTGDPRHFLVRKKPHSQLKSRTWRKTLQLHAMVAGGGGFSEVIRDPDTGLPMAIIPLDPNRVGWGVITDAQNRPIRTVYVYQDNPGTSQCRAIDMEDMIHIKGLSWDAIMGIDTTKLLQREFGLILARQNYTRKYYVGNARIRGFLMVPAGTDMALYSNMMQVISDHMSQQDADPLKTVPLFDGVKYQATQDSPENSELTESLKMTPDTVAVITGVPPFFLGADTRDSYNSLEKVMQGFFTTTADDLFDEWESELDDKLLTEDELREDELGFRFDRERLMATDVATFHKMLREDMHAGLLAWEECRESLDRTTDTSDLTFMVPQNVVGAEPTSLNGLSDSGGMKNDADDMQNSVVPNRKTIAAVMRLMNATAERYCDRLVNAAVAKSGNIDKFESFLASIEGSAKNRELEIELSHMRPVFDVAIESGLLDSAPDWTIVSRFHTALNAAINTNHANRPFPDVVNDVCRTTTQSVVAELTQMLIPEPQEA